MTDMVKKGQRHLRKTMILTISSFDVTTNNNASEMAKWGMT